MTSEPGDSESVVLNSVGYQQTVTIIGSSAEAPVRTHGYLIEDEDTVLRSLTLGSPSEKILAEHAAATEIKFVATMPANREAFVRFENKGTTPTEVSISIKN